METQTKEKRGQPWCLQGSPGLETQWWQGPCSLSSKAGKSRVLEKSLGNRKEATQQEYRFWDQINVNSGSFSLYSRILAFPSLAVTRTRYVHKHLGQCMALSMLNNWYLLILQMNLLVLSRFHACPLTPSQNVSQG